MGKSVDDVLIEMENCEICVKNRKEIRANKQDEGSRRDIVRNFRHLAHLIAMEEGGKVKLLELLSRAELDVLQDDIISFIKPLSDHIASRAAQSVSGRLSDKGGSNTGVDHNG